MYSLTVLLKKKKTKNKNKKLKQNTMFTRKIMSNEMASTLLKRELEVKYYMSSWQWLPIAQLSAKKKKKNSNIKLLEYHFWISSIGVCTNSGFPHVVFESDLLTKKLPLLK